SKRQHLYFLSCPSRRAVFSAVAVVGVALMLGLPAAASAATLPGAVTTEVNSTGPTTATVDGAVEPVGASTTYAVEYDVAGSTWCTSNGASGVPAQTTSATDLGATDYDYHDVSVDL